jgi:hypothetical protein
LSLDNLMSRQRKRLKPVTFRAHCTSSQNGRWM